MRRDKAMNNYDTMLKMHRQEELDAQIEELEESISDIDEEIDYRLNLTFNKAQKRNVRAALSNTFGFGGHNASIIVKKI